MKDIILNNGVKMPIIGYGTFKVSDEEVCDLVKDAVKVGYRHIDTAAYYGNEKGIGKALNEIDIPREEMFITSKVWIDDFGYDKTMKSFEDTIEKLDLEYLDLLLIHWPRFSAIESYKAFEKLYEKGRVKAIGVSNYTTEYLKELLENTQIKPVVNQLEINPYFTRNDIIDYCKKLDIAVEAWAPIMKGEVSNEKKLIEIAKKYGKTPAQVTLRWHIQRNIIAIPKTMSKTRMIENINIFDFELTKEDMRIITALNKDERHGPSSEDIYINGFKRK